MLPFGFEPTGEDVRFIKRKKLNVMRLARYVACVAKNINERYQFGKWEVNSKMGPKETGC
jgi:hypothetical protein